MKLRSKFVLTTTGLSSVFVVILCLLVAAAFDQLAGPGVSTLYLKAWLVAGSALFLVLNSGATFWLARRLCAGLMRAIAVVEKIAQGNMSDKLPMGTAVQCSTHKQCSEPDCPSYGKLDHCWVTSGSYATIKHCPRARRGETAAPARSTGRMMSLRSWGRSSMPCPTTWVSGNGWRWILPRAT